MLITAVLVESYLSALRSYQVKCLEEVLLVYGMAVEVSTRWSPNLTVPAPYVLTRSKPFAASHRASPKSSSAWVNR